MSCRRGSSLLLTLVNGAGVLFFFHGPPWERVQNAEQSDILI
jgi:hypothetical protein